MTPLRSKFVSFLELRGYTGPTVRNYVQAVKQFSVWLGCSPLKMTSDKPPRTTSPPAPPGGCRIGKGASPLWP